LFDEKLRCRAKRGVGGIPVQAAWRVQKKSLKKHLQEIVLPRLKNGFLIPNNNEAKHFWGQFCELGYFIYVYIVQSKIILATQINNMSIFCVQFVSSTIMVMVQERSRAKGFLMYQH
jgi:hypothetical protein